MDEKELSKIHETFDKIDEILNEEEKPKRQWKPKEKGCFVDGRTASWDPWNN